MAWAMAWSWAWAGMVMGVVVVVVMVVPMLAAAAMLVPPSALTWGQGQPQTVIVGPNCNGIWRRQRSAALGPRGMDGCRRRTERHAKPPLTTGAIATGAGPHGTRGNGMAGAEPFYSNGMAGAERAMILVILSLAAMQHAHPCPCMW